MIDFQKLKLRKVQLYDALLIYKWAIDPTVRQNSLNSNSFSFESHLIWLKNKLNDNNTEFYILEELFPLGQIRFDKINEGWLINFLIDENFRGLGLGYSIVKMGMEQVKGNKFIAYVKKDNLPSNKIFRKLLFVEQESDIVNTNKWIKYV